MLLASSGRAFVAVAMHEKNFGPSNRTAVVMKLAMNWPSGVCGTSEARTVIDGETWWANVGGLCWAGTERIESAAIAATKAKQCRIIGPKDIGGIAAQPDSLERQRPNKQFPSLLAPGAVQNGNRSRFAALSSCSSRA